jgi:hypothetical protein
MEYRDDVRRRGIADGTGDGVGATGAPRQCKFVPVAAIV